MALVDLVMPKLGESIIEATILKWHKKAGESVKQDETVLDIATDKVDSEVPSTSAGTLAEVLFMENDVVPIGSVIARIETGNAESNGTNGKKILQEQLGEEVPYLPQALNTNVSTSTAPSNNINRFYSPLVLNIAQSESISMSELEKIPGTGNDGRVSKKDVLKFVENRKATVESEQSTADSQQSSFNSEQAVIEQQEISGQQLSAPQQIKPETKEAQHETESQPSTVSYGNAEIIEMDRMRKMIAKHMVDSKRISPHVTSFSEADVTNIVLWREKVKQEFEKRENTKITFTPIFIDCLVRVIKRFPMINSSLDGEKIILKKDINISMATALPSGNLIVPVIRNADYLNLVGLSKQVNTLADNARTNKLKPDDIQGGTFTLTNVGTFGSLMGTPIINQPQVAILAVGAIKKRPVVIETEQGDTIGIRHMMYLSLSYDHRIVDGSLGASFLTAVAKEFESWSVEREW